MTEKEVLEKLEEMILKNYTVGDKKKLAEEILIFLKKEIVVVAN